MNVLVACEFSPRVRNASRTLGHNAWSVDLEPTEGDPEYHIIGDAIGVAYRVHWDLVIAFPPCTRLTTAGARHWPAWQADGSQQAAAAFVAKLWACPALHVAIENPWGYLNTNWRKPTQTVNPYDFGDPWKKRTGLWLRGLPVLVADQSVTPGGSWVGGGSNRMATTGPIGGHRKPRERSRTFPGIARAMAEQWGGHDYVAVLTEQLTNAA